MVTSASSSSVTPVTDHTSASAAINAGKAALHRTLEQLGEVLLGKHAQLELAMACLLARGHLLIEDLPGMGKTTLAHGLAAALGLDYQRIQFTSDMLPADITGVAIFNQQTSQFEFREGPVFTQLLLGDEINRATPKTQGALLEAMEERQVTSDGVTRPLPEPFFVIATQNPLEQMGTFPLPESQLDRFLMCISLGYPDPAVERELILGQDRRAMVANLTQTLNLEQLTGLQAAVDAVHLSPAVVDYVQRLVAYTRTEAGLAYGLSPRGTLALVRASRAFAVLRDRAYVVPEDVQTVLLSVVSHRLPQGSGTGEGSQSHQVVRAMLNTVPVIDS